MRRRDFVIRLGGTVLAWPFAALAQRLAMPVIGFLHSASADERKHLVEAFRRGLKEGGLVEGKDVAIEFRWADGRYDRLTALATDLVNRKVSVIVAQSTPATLAAKAATSAIPVVFNASGDPVKLGIVASLARPTANVTGIANIGSSLAAKRLEILRDMLPAAKEIAYFANPKFPGANSMTKEVQAAAVATTTKLQIVNASSEAEIDAAFAAIKQGRANAVLVSADSFFLTRRDQIVALAARYAIPACYAFREYAVAGGLMSYGPDLIDSSRQQGQYTARILKGAKPAELPVVQSSKIELLLNGKAARKLGLVVAREFLARVDEVIE